MSASSKSLLSVGSKVIVGPSNRKGKVMFIGDVHFSTGEWVGVKLDVPEGKNDGSVGDVRYFECDPNYGLFVKKAQLKLDVTLSESRRSSLSSRTSDIGLARPVERSANKTSTVTPARPVISTRRTSIDSKALSTPKSSSIPVPSRATPQFDSVVPSRENIVETNEEHDSYSKINDSNNEFSPANEILEDNHEDIPIIESSPASVNIESAIKDEKLKYERLLEEYKYLQSQLIENAEALKLAQIQNNKLQSQSLDQSSKKESEIDRILTEERSRYSLLHDDYQLLKSRLSDALEKLSSQETQNLELKSKLKDNISENNLISESALNEEIKNLKFQNSTLNNKILEQMSLNETISRLQVSLKEEESKSEKLTEFNSSLQLQLSNATNTLKQMELKNSELMTRINDDNMQLQNKIKKLETQVLELTDGMEMLALDKEQYQVENELLQESLENLKASILNGKPDIISTSSSIDELQFENSKLREALRKLDEISKTNIDALNIQIGNLNSRVQDTDHLTKELLELKKCDAESQIKINELKQIVEESSAYEEMIESLTEANSALQTRLQELTVIVGDLESEQELMEELDSRQRSEIDQNRKQIDRLEIALNEKNQEILTLKQAASDASIMIDNYKSLIEQNRTNMEDRERALNNLLQEQSLQTSRLVEAASLKYSVDDLLSTIVNSRLGYIYQSTKMKIFECNYQIFVDSFGQSNLIPAELRSFMKNRDLVITVIGQLLMMVDLLTPATNILSSQEFSILCALVQYCSSCAQLGIILLTNLQSSTASLFLARAENICHKLFELMKTQTQFSLSSIDNSLLNSLDTESESLEKFVVEFLETINQDSSVSQECFSLKLSSLFVQLFAVERVANIGFSIKRKLKSEINLFFNVSPESTSESIWFLPYSSDTLDVINDFMDVRRSFIEAISLGNDKALDGICKSFFFTMEKLKQNTSNGSSQLIKVYSNLSEFLNTFGQFKDDSVMKLSNQFVSALTSNIRQSLLKQEQAIAIVSTLEHRIQELEEENKKRGVELKFSIQRYQEMENALKLNSSQLYVNDNQLPSNAELKKELSELREALIGIQVKYEHAEKENRTLKTRLSSFDMSAMLQNNGNISELKESLSISRSKEQAWRNLAIKKLALYMRDFNCDNINKPIHDELKLTNAINILRMEKTTRMIQPLS